MRVAVIGDVHGNDVAFRSIIEDFGQVDAVWCVGDLVGYGPAPNECVGLLREMSHLCVAGNHDWAALGRVPITDFNPDAAAACRWTARQLSDESRRYLEALPSTMAQGDFTLVHGSPREPIWEYLASRAEAAASFEHFATPYCFVGHTHVPVVFSEPGADPPVVVAYGEQVALAKARLIINPGSVGQPRDGVPDARYILLNTEGATIEYRRVPYDVERTQQDMRRFGLPPMLVERLAYGW